MSDAADSDAESDIAIDFDNEERKGPVQKVTGPQHVLSPENHGLRRLGASPPGKLVGFFRERRAVQSQKSATRVPHRSEGVGRHRVFPPLATTPVTSNTPASNHDRALHESDADVILIDHDENDEQRTTKPNSTSGHTGKRPARSRKSTRAHVRNGSNVESGGHQNRNEITSAVQKKARLRHRLDSSSDDDNDDDDDNFEEEKPKPAPSSRGAGPAFQRPASPQEASEPEQDQKVERVTPLRRSTRKRRTLKQRSDEKILKFRQLKDAKDHDSRRKASGFDSSPSEYEDDDDANSDSDGEMSRGGARKPSKRPSGDIQEWIEAGDSSPASNKRRGPKVGISAVCRSAAAPKPKAGRIWQTRRPSASSRGSSSVKQVKRNSSRVEQRSTVAQMFDRQRRAQAAAVLSADESDTSDSDSDVFRMTQTDPNSSSSATVTTKEVLSQAKAGVSESSTPPVKADSTHQRSSTRTAREHFAVSDDGSINPALEPWEQNLVSLGLGFVAEHLVFYMKKIAAFSPHLIASAEIGTSHRSMHDLANENPRALLQQLWDKDAEYAASFRSGDAASHRRFDSVLFGNSAPTPFEVSNMVANDPIPLVGFVRFASQCGILRLKSHRILKLVGEHARALTELIGLRPLHVLLHSGIEGHEHDSSTGVVSLMNKVVYKIQKLMQFREMSGTFVDDQRIKAATHALLLGRLYVRTMSSKEVKRARTHFDRLQQTFVDTDHDKPVKIGTVAGRKMLEVGHPEAKKLCGLESFEVVTCFLCQTYKKCPASVLEVVSKVDRGGGAAGGGEPAPPSQGRAGKAKRQSKVSVLTEPVQIESDEGEEDDDDDIDGQVYEDGDLKIGCAHNICHVCASSVSVAIFFCEFLRSWCSFRKYAVVDVLRNTIEREMREEKSAVDDESTELELDAAVEDTWRQLGCIGMAVVAAVLEASPIDPDSSVADQRTRHAATKFHCERDILNADVML